jgi:DNA repair protein RadC
MSNGILSTQFPEGEQKMLDLIEDQPPVEYHATVHDLPVDDRPRERLQQGGAETLSTVDLLAIILRTGTKQDNVIELSQKLLAKYGGLSGLVTATFQELCNEYGMGAAKSAQLKAALELGKRLSTLQPMQRYRIRSAADVATLLRMEMMYLDHEEIHILVLDAKQQVIEHVKRYKGTVNGAMLRVSEIFRHAIIRNCPNIIVCHNHPSGDPTPSEEDYEVTEQLIQAGHLLDITLLDHIIIGNPDYASIREEAYPGRFQW